MDDVNLFDTWRINNPTKRQYTWKSAYRLVKLSRLDYFLITDDLQNVMKNIKIISGYRTDHSLITLELEFNENKRGKGVWKFNTSLLYDNDYKTIIRNLIAEESERYGKNENNLTDLISDQLFFDTLKLCIRGSTIAYSSNKKRNKLEREKYLQNKIESLENDILSGNIDPISLDNLEETKEQLQRSREENIRGIMIRSRSLYYEQGERPTRYFLSLEKHNYVSNLSIDYKLKIKY